MASIHIRAAFRPRRSVVSQRPAYPSSPFWITLFRGNLHGNVHDEVRDEDERKRDTLLERRFPVCAAAKLSTSVDHWNFTTRPVEDVHGNEISRFNWRSSACLEGGIEASWLKRSSVLPFVSVVRSVDSQRDDGRRGTPLFHSPFLCLPRYKRYSMDGNLARLPPE